MRQVENHVSPGLDGIPSIWMVFGSLFQEHVNYFTINMLLLTSGSITEQDMGINILESGVLVNPEKENLMVDKSILNRV